MSMRHDARQGFERRKFVLCMPNLVWGGDGRDDKISTGHILMIKAAGVQLLREVRLDGHVADRIYQGECSFSGMVACECTEMSTFSICSEDTSLVVLCAPTKTLLTTTPIAHRPSLIGHNEGNIIFSTPNSLVKTLRPETRK